MARSIVLYRHVQLNQFGIEVVLLKKEIFVILRRPGKRPVKTRLDLIDTPIKSRAFI